MVLTQSVKHVDCFLRLTSKITSDVTRLTSLITETLNNISLLVVMYRPAAILHPDFIAQLQRSGQYPPNLFVPVLNFPFQPQILANPAGFINPVTLPVQRNDAADLREKIRTDILRKLKHEGSESPRLLSPDFATDSLDGVTMFKAARNDNVAHSRSNSSKENPGMKRPRSGSRFETPKKPRMGKPGEKGFPTGIQWSIPQAIAPTGAERISESIWQYFLQTQQTEDIYQAKVRLRNALYAVFQGVFPFCGLYIVGSSMNGFGTRNSDMDLCLMLSIHNIDQRKEATEILFLLQKSLRNCFFVKKCQVIRAAVPILRFWDKCRDFECDLNINNAVGIRNTHLLRYYATMDWRVRPLMLYIKFWARFHDINDARKKTISSYSLGLMLIHYLQVGCNPPVLPCLQTQFPKTFQPDADIRELKLNEKLPLTETQNKDSLGDLFLGFLEYYSFKFNFDADAISIRLGARVPRGVMIKQTTDNQRQWKCLCIEEPFDRSNTARSVYDEFTFQRVQRVFRNSFFRLRKTNDIESITSVPF
ncbi:poly(A) RNA polymerase gld-2 homolog A-like [Haliotis rufescens]|uniref:poly(A) RNA polymerase gld-2 homolog A-like n=1 Tax=Haliotis rufescens TaxID=6454 RepID=UPI001EAFBC18|nr:poly(A) RNA polymerase gld-2 homolog A-like [Haliotis rufescens]